MSNDKANFYLHWLWEYTRRNAKYRQLAIELSADGKSQSAFSLNGFAVGQLDKPFATSSNILYSLIRGDFSHHFPPHCIYPLSTTAKMSYKDPGRVSIDVDLSYSNSQILHDITILLDISRFTDSAIASVVNGNKTIADAFTGKVDTDLPTSLGIKNTYDVSGLKTNDVPRAIGLWIWDYLEDKYGQQKLPRGAIAESVEALKSQFDITKLGYARSAQKCLEDRYRVTCKCIELCEVLPF